MEPIPPEITGRMLKFLPSGLAGRLRAGEQGEALAAEAQGYLERLALATQAYLPGFVLDEILRGPAASQVDGQFRQGALLFADISGFTAMSEALSRAGRAGAEEITGLVNEFFEGMLTVLHANGGQLIKFGGDALLGLFLQEEDGRDPAGMAVQTGLAMQAGMAHYTATSTTQGIFRLAMRVAVHFGRVFAARLGDQQGMEFALFGADVRRTAWIEEHAAAGSVTVAATTLSRLGSQFEGVLIPSTGLYEIRARVGESAQRHTGAVNEPTGPGDGQTAPAAALDEERPAESSSFVSQDTLTRRLAELEGLAPYLPAGLLPRLVESHHDTAPAGEHRQAGVLFALVGGLGEIADRLGPGQEARIMEALNRYYLGMARVIRSYGAVINKIDIHPDGDKLLALFGAPLAHEDEPERSVRAALAMQAEIGTISDWLEKQPGLEGHRLSQKIGINYGPLFAGYVGTAWRREYTVMGDEVNTAARILGAAEAGMVQVSQAVQRRTGKLFVNESLGSVKVKGKSRPVAVYAVRGEPRTGEESAGPRRGLSPFVGREAQLEQMLAAAGRLVEGSGTILAVTGEPGVGKSRLVLELRERMERSGSRVLWLEGRCLSYAETISYGLFQEPVRRVFGILPGDTVETALGKILERLVALHGENLARSDLPYLASLLNLPQEGNWAAAMRFLDPEAVQRGIFLAFRRLLEALARQAPLGLVLEDLHWMDLASSQLLERLLPLARRTRVLFCLLFRPEREKGCWHLQEKAGREQADRFALIHLPALSESEAGQLFDSLSGVRFSSPARRKILERVEGNPLYLEETLRSYLSSESGSGFIIEDLNVPDSLSGVMMAHLDRLHEPTRWVAQVSAILGRTFSRELLANILGESSREQMDTGLDELRSQEVLVQVRQAPQAAYAFRHVLMQDVCYDCLPVRTRREFHRRIAYHLAGQGDRAGYGLENSLPAVAHHAYTGQAWEIALRYQALSGRRAKQLFANQEAISHFEKALESAVHLGEQDTLAEQQEVELALGELHLLVTHFDESTAHLERAYRLAGERSDTGGQVQACRWIARRHELGGDFPTALEWIARGLELNRGAETPEAAQLHIQAGLIRSRQGADEQAFGHAETALKIAGKTGQLTVLARANNMLGVIARNRGDNAGAAAYFKRALAGYVEAGDIHGQAITHNLVANVQFNTGQWILASAQYQQAREIFDQLGDLYNLAIACNNLGGIALNQGRLEDALEAYVEATLLLEQVGASAYLRGIVQMNVGATCVRQGKVSEALRHLQRSQEYFSQAQARDFLPELNRHIARASLAGGDRDTALRHAREALSLAREQGMKTEEGCALRVLGEVLGEGDEAAACLRESIEILEGAGEEYETACSRQSLAGVYRKMGRLEAAGEEEVRSRVVFERMGVR